MSSDKAPRFHYRLGLNQPEMSPTARRIKEMAGAVGEETGGEFRLEVFAESRLGPDPKMLADLRRGELEFYLSGAILGALAPTSLLPLLPFAFADAEAVFAALDGRLGERIRGELARSGLYAFPRSWQNGFHHLTTAARPICGPEDLAGLKIRTPGGEIAADFFRTLGAEPGMVPFNQLYEALKTRRFDGQSDPLGVVLSLRLHEVQSHLSLSAHWWSGFTLLAGGAAYRALPQEIREVLERNAEKFALLQRQDVAAVNARGVAELAAKGMTVREADTRKIRGRLGDFYLRWCERTGREAWALLESYAGAIGG